MFFPNRSWSLELPVCAFSPDLAIIKTPNFFALLEERDNGNGGFPKGCHKNGLAV